MGGAIRIPQRKRAVVVESRRELVNLVIHSSIFSVDIIKQRGSNHHVIQPGVEDLFVLLIWRLDSNPREFPPPTVASCTTHLGKIPLGNFSFQILQCTFDTYA
jgi:hypothetical protein